MGLREIRVMAVAITIAPYIRGNKLVVFLLSEHHVSCTLNINEKEKTKTFIPLLLGTAGGMHVDIYHLPGVRNAPLESCKR